MSLQCWHGLRHNLARLEDCQYSGAYIVAYNDHALDGRPVDLGEVSSADISDWQGGVRHGPRQVMRAVGNRFGFSVVNTFFTDYSERAAVHTSGGPQRHFLASASVPHIAVKASETPADVRRWTASLFRGIMSQRTSRRISPRAGAEQEARSLPGRGV